MPSYIPPVRGQAFSFEMGLLSQADPDVYQVNPTLAPGDVLVIKDGVLDGNIDALPTVIVGATDTILVTCSADEATADRVTVAFKDAAGDEWQSCKATFWTAGQTLDIIDTNVDSVLDDTDDIGVAGAGLTALPAMVWASATRTLTSFGTLVADAAAAVWAYVTRTLTASSGVAFPAGAIEYTYTVTDSGTGLPIEGVEIWFATDAFGANIVWAGITDAFGVARDVLDSKPWLDAGTYYVGRKKAGYTFGPDADVEVVSA